MKIIIHDYSGHPFQVQLSRVLAQRNYNVLHLTAKFFQTPKGNLMKGKADPDNFRIEALDIHRPFKKHTFIQRRNQEHYYGTLLAKIVKDEKPDVVISSNTPLDAQKVLLSTCRDLNIKFIFWLQDVYSLAIDKVLRQKIPILGSIIGRYYTFMEKKLLSNSTHIIAITEDFIPLLLNWGITKSKIIVIPNWAPINEVPVLEKDNDWSRRNDLVNKFCFLYSGTLGFKHNPQILLDLARRYVYDAKVRIIIISEGPALDWLKSEALRLSLENILFLSFQPFEVLPQILATADVCISILEPDAGVYSVPSKVLTYLCAKRPLLLSVPLENLASKIVEKTNCGLVSNPCDKQSFLSNADLLLSDERRRSEMGTNAREYAEQNFEINKIVDEFEILLNQTNRG